MENIRTTIITFIIVIVIVFGCGLLLGMSLAAIGEMFLIFIMLGGLFVFPMLIIEMVQHFGTKDLHSAMAVEEGRNTVKMMYAAKDYKDQIEEDRKEQIDDYDNVHVLSDHDFSKI